MPIEIKMPALSPTMTEGNLAKWLKQEGDTVKAGDVIAEIETDKATMEVEAVEEGTLTRILIQAGTEAVKVGTPIAILHEEGEAADAVLTPKTVSPPAQEAAPAAAPAVAAPVALAVSPTLVGDDRIVASPLAKRMAAQAGLDLKTIAGSGPNGRIVKQDVETALAKGLAKPASPAASPAVARTPEVQAPAAPAALSEARVAALGGNGAYTLQPHTGMRKTIAKRLSEAKQTVPHFYLTIACELDALLKVRAELNGRSKDQYKLSVNDFVIRASALALKKVPAANASWSDDGVLLWQNADVAVAVAIDGGLITPIVKAAQTKGLAEISNEMKDLGTRAKAGKLKLDEFQGGTFSISNLGMFGISEFSAVINPPHGAILAVGAGEQRPVVKDGALSIATVMTVTLSVDHRVIDGAVGAAFLSAFKGYIEDPLSMLL